MNRGYGLVSNPPPPGEISLPLARSDLDPEHHLAFNLSSVHLSDNTAALRMTYLAFLDPLAERDSKSEECRQLSGYNCNRLLTSTLTSTIRVATDTRTSLI